MRGALVLALIVVLVTAPGALGQTPPPIVRLTDDDFRPVPEPSRLPRASQAPVEDRLGTPELSRPVVAAPTPHLVVEVVAGPASGRLVGRASWYCRPGVSICAKGFPYGGNYAAAGPRLRAALCGSQACTSWRGRTVYVNGVEVRLIDWCQCYRNEAHEKLIDLYYNVFKQTGGQVTITW